MSYEPEMIEIAFVYNADEMRLLRLGGCDQPHPNRIKMMLLREAARNLRHMAEGVVNTAQAAINARADSVAVTSNINPYSAE